MSGITISNCTLTNDFAGYNESLVALAHAAMENAKAIAEIAKIYGQTNIKTGSMINVTQTPPVVNKDPIPGRYPSFYEDDNDE